MKNRKREICTSVSVRDKDGQHPHLLGRRRFLHLAAVTVAARTAMLPVSRIARAQTYPAKPVRIIVGFGRRESRARPVGPAWIRNLV
jgi:hypothetical protein